jgi:hypothetical protein
MEELHKIAKAYYETANSENKDLGHRLFKRMDVDGDGQISLHEFLAFLKNEGRGEMASPSFFKELNKNGTGRLDLMEAMTLCYIMESGRKFCNGCGEFMKGIFLSCMECFDHEDRSFNLCCACFEQGRYVHSHKKFLDNYVLLETKRLDALKEKNAAKTKLRREAEKKRVGEEIKKNVNPVAVAFFNFKSCVEFKCFSKIFNLLIIYFCCRLQPQRLLRNGSPNL